jgi:hypothetical protein
LGELYLHDLKKYKCNIFVETGTGIGTGVSHALKYKFERLYSIEINHQLHHECLDKFNDDRLELIHNTSFSGLNMILHEINKNDKVLFWLDAHFPGADFQMGSYDDDISDILKFPLESEINLIYKNRKDCKDVFIIDDLQLFEEGDFELKWEQEFIDKFRRSNEFIYNKYSNTHNFIKDYRHQGFLILEPKNDIDST